ncbi:hypothetical protein GGI43DRAFT_423628 [Trichoderma evansii]
MTTEKIAVALGATGNKGGSVVNNFLSTSGWQSIYFDPANKDKSNPGQALNAWTAKQEAQQLKNVIDVAAKIPTLERFVLSSSPNAKKEKYPDLFAKTSVFRLAWFLSSQTTSQLFMPTKALLKEPRGKAVFGLRELLTLRTGLAAETLYLTNGRFSIETSPELKLQFGEA